MYNYCFGGIANKNLPKTIYLGVKYDQNTEYKKFLLERLCEELDIPTHQTTLHQTQYKIVPKT